MTLPPNFHIVKHSLIQHKMTFIRDTSTKPKVFRELVDEITILVATEATKDLPLKIVETETPLTRTTTKILDVRDVVIVPILRAGFGMVNGVTRLIPNAKIGSVGLERDHETHRPVDYYFNVPTSAENQIYLVLDPMLATGGTAIATVDKLKNMGANTIKFICLIAAPEGITAFSNSHPEVDVYSAVLDEKLNSQKYIVPGLGDAGDRLFGTE